MNPPVCPSCGARLAPGATQCDLCGQVLDDASADAVPPAEDAGEPASDAERAASAESAEPDTTPPADPTPAPVVADDELSGPFCIHCGAKNPNYARFCYNCGRALHTADIPEGTVPATATVATEPVASEEGESAVRPVPPSPATTGVRPDSDPGKRALVLVGAGVLAVLVLFFLTQAMQDEAPAAQPAGATPTAQSAPSTPTELPDDVLAEVDRLEGEIEAATSEEERLGLQEQLAGLYAQSGAFDRAAEVQHQVAEVRNTALGWADAGSLYLAHMLRTSGPERADYAARAAAHYERSLELNPDDLDVKTDLATAYLNDATNPMQAVQTVKEVLETNPDHVRANFNYGLMLAQINRVDPARVQFEKVIGLTEPEDPVHQRAEQELARLSAAQSGTAAGGTTAG